jgi:hypothetical protein
MKGVFKSYFAAAVLACAVSCTQYDEVETRVAPVSAPGREVTAYLPLKVVSLERAGGSALPLTRATPVFEDDVINDVWVFQFGEPAIPGDDDSRPLVCPPYYIDETVIQDAVDLWNEAGNLTLYPHIAVPLIESRPGEVHKVVLAANINSREFNWGMSVVAGQESSYADLKERVIIIESESNSHSGDRTNLIMSGSVLSAITPDIVLDDDPAHHDDDGNDELGVPLYRSLSRIELDLSVNPSVNFRVLSVQLRNIPQRIEIFDRLIAEDGNLSDNSLYPEPLTLMLDYDKIHDPAGLDLTQEFAWYIPRNMRGRTGSYSAKTKNTFAPQGATYIEVTAVDLDNNSTFIYRVYPGLNEENDHTIKSNHIHHVDLTINGYDDRLKNDSRIEHY